MKAKRILVVDADEAFRGLVRSALKRLPCDLVFAAGGREGLHQAQSQPFHLVLLELALPDLNGVEVYRLLRCDERMRRTPVLGVTSLDRSCGVIKSAAMALGMSDFLYKPFGEEDLLGRVKSLLDSGARPAPAPAPARAPAPKGPCIERGRVRVELNSRRVWVDGQPVRPMGPRRFQLLCTLLRHRGDVQRQRLCSEVWGESEDCKKVDITISRLREDLGLKDDNLIISVPGGYKFVG